MTKGFLFLPFLSLFLIHCHPDSKEEIKDFSHLFDEYNVEGAFVLYDLQQDQWFVGYIEKDKSVYFFATNIASNQPEDSFLQARKAISLNILKQLDILE